MWIVGIDEAGYGPNLGPFVMTCVACRTAEASVDADLWQRLRAAVRRSHDADDGRLLLDDSKRVYTSRGLAGLERGVWATLGSLNETSLAELIAWACPDDGDELRREVWYRGIQSLPMHGASDELESASMRFAEACGKLQIGPWHVRAAVVCPQRFNALLEEGGTKGHVLAHALTSLLRWLMDCLPNDEAVTIYVDKHGGRNSYVAMLQNALPHSLVVAERESMASSVYRLHGLGREVRLTFQPRADGEHLCVALASMASKYLREVLMVEFNRFWREHLPDLKPTAGYPLDAARFFREIRPTMEALGLSEECVWRRK